MKLAFFGFHGLDEPLDPFQRKFVAHARRDLAVVVDPPVELLALRAHNSHSLIR
jgi:hypothetical protein